MCDMSYWLLSDLHFKTSSNAYKIAIERYFYKKQIVQNEQHCSQGSQRLLTLTDVDSRFTDKDYRGLSRNGMHHHSKYQAESYF